jgi:hypothetical protein
VKNRFQILPFKCNLHRYSEAVMVHDNLLNTISSRLSFDGEGSGRGLSTTGTTDGLSTTNSSGYTSLLRWGKLYNLNPVETHSLKAPGFKP